nr:MAG TPA: hypothetical protein [Caudoviricetes sp.]
MGGEGGVLRGLDAAGHGGQHFGGGGGGGGGFWGAGHGGFSFSKGGGKGKVKGGARQSPVRARRWSSRRVCRRSRSAVTRNVRRVKAGAG